MNPDELGRVIHAFADEPDEALIRAERAKAKQLRKTRWWQQKTASGECWYCGACVMVCPVEGAVSLRHPLMNRAKFVTAAQLGRRKPENGECRRNAVQHELRVSGVRDFP